MSKAHLACVVDASWVRNQGAHMTIDAILALHIVGLMMGAGGGFGSMLTGREALKRPADQAVALRSRGPILANFPLWASS
jgi:hypothetical protein